VVGLFEYFRGDVAERAGKGGQLLSSGEWRHFAL